MLMARIRPELLLASFLKWKTPKTENAVGLPHVRTDLSSKFVFKILHKRSVKLYLVLIKLSYEKLAT